MAGDERLERVMSNSQPVFLSGWASYHPEGALTNDDLVERLDTTKDWLETHIGIDERRKAAVDESIADMGAIAALGAVRSAGIEVSDLDLLIGATSYDDFMLPAAAARIGDAIGSQAHAFDVKAACSGWMVGLDVAESFLTTGKATRVLVSAAEKSDLGVDPTDRTSLPFFGDAAVGAVVQLERPAVGMEVLDIRRASDNAMHGAVEIPYAGWFRMDATRTRIWVEAAIAKTAQEILDHAGISAADIRVLVCHQANLRLIERIASDLGVPPERHWHNVRWAGNTASAGAPSALIDGLSREQSDLEDGDLILMVTVGAGLNVIGALLRWVSD
jgi:3-oxoacyl-[acyl-carrier-protein] synthase-3